MTASVHSRNEAQVLADEAAARQAVRKQNIFVFIGFAIFFLYAFLDKPLHLNLLGPLLGILIYLILAMGLNIVVGYAGLLDLGYAAFFAIGAYAMALMTSPQSVLVRRDYIPDRLQNFWAAMAISWLVAACFGVLLGAPTLRLRGDYLAIVTLGFGEIVPNFFLNAKGISNGTKGINPIAKPPTFDILGHTFRFSSTDQRNWYWLTLVVGVLSMFVIRRLYDSRLGRAWVAIREDEVAASSMGINLVKTKLWAFALGASFSGFAGSIYSSAFQLVNPDSFSFSISVTILAMVILGGLGNIYGVILGGLIIAGFDRILAEKLNDPVQHLGRILHIGPMAHHNLTQDKLLVFGLALLLMMLFRPEGLLPSGRTKREMHEPQESQIVIPETAT